MRHRLQVLLQILLALVACLLGIATNYATNTDHAPWALEVIRRGSVPAIGLLIVAMVVGQVVVYRLENPVPPPAEWPRDRIPYPGLDAYSEDEAAVYFGREAQAAELTRRLHAAAPRPTGRFLVLTGASGSGKSSLVRAGVLPRLRRRRWTIVPAFSPGANPLLALASSLAVARGGGESSDVLLRRLRQGPESLAAELSRLRGGQFRRVLLVIDQFEELVTLASEREQVQFWDMLHTCLQQEPSVRILTTCRVDLLGRLLGSGHGEFLQHPVAIGTLNRTQLAQVVERPAALVGISYAPGLVETIVDDTGTDDALPLLAYLLQELYFLCGPGGTVTEEMYQQLGGVAGALARQADNTVAALGTPDGVDFALRVLLKFVTLEERDLARRPVRLSELTDRERYVVDAFIDARLIRSDAAEGASDGVSGRQEAYAKVTHEALFRQWAPLRQEAEARAERLRERAELERWATDWERSGRSVDYLLTGERLTVAQRWLVALEEAGQASAPARALVEASQRRDLAFLSSVSDSIGRQVQAIAETEPELALLLSLAALGECAPTPAARRGLMTALAASHIRIRLDGHSDTVRDIAWSDDGQLLATASRDGTARVYEARSGRQLYVLPCEGAMVESVSFSPDATRLATAGRDQVVRIWDVTSGEPVRHLVGAGDIGRQVAWSPDGVQVAATFKDQVVRVWEAGTGRLVRELTGHTGDVWGITWSPDGSRLATASHDRTVIVWDAVTGSPTMTLTGHSEFVEGITWSPDGESLATGSGDHTARIWDARTGAQRLLLRGHTDYVWNPAFSPDGRFLATPSSDRTVRVVRTEDAKVVAVLRGHTDTVWTVVWSPLGTRLATASTDGTGRVWDLQPQGAESVLVQGHDGPVNQAVWSSDGTRLATACDDGTARVWNAESGRPVGPITTLDERVWSLAWAPHGDRLALSTADGLFRVVDGTGCTVFDLQGEPIEGCSWSPDARRIAVGSHNGAVGILSAVDGAELRKLTGHQDWVGRVAWSPSGRKLASCSDDRTCRLWDTADGTQLTVLRGHANYVEDASWSPDEARVATASGDWTAAVWDTATGRRIEVLKGHEGRVRAIAWSPDGRRIATGSDDRTVRLWSSTTFEELAVIGVHRDKVTSVAWSPDGTRLLTASTDGTVRVWRADPDYDRLEARARGRVFRTLVAEERRQHLLPPDGA
ncbi:nSTAND1 domain-containing NTPase [Streptomyces nodosus]|uniref:NACHT domain-containing protein n=1 Tax=Streptomyces nodosus TaxID=40318 RepID=A0A0B5DI44_9ACTN|nr:AAA family ATPase [Streptomyces nodosus]AJE40855.1 WD40 repeat, subgroup [Streptomyces nodosus]MBB4791937.1 WD40 repeat protein [Streptomyces nodosus]QEV39402.1 NACHT domain-containing protein [Streptomyces nodosus]